MSGKENKIAAGALDTEMTGNQLTAGAGERMDDIGFSGYRLIQRPGEFCYGIDAVLLADFAQVKEGGRVCDLGTGTGVIPLILRHKTRASEIWGVELLESSARLAQRNMELNGLSGQIHILRGDVKDAVEILGTGGFDTVVSNPPYIKSGGGMVSEKSAKMTARHESSASLSDFLQAAAGLLKERGSFFMVHRPSRLTDVFFSCRRWRLEPRRLRLVTPRTGQSPNLLLLQCVKNGGAELTVLPQLTVYGEDGSYTEEILKIYERA